MKDSEMESGSPCDPREVARAISLRRQAIPPHKKGDLVWAANGPLWEKALIERRLPGGVYAARFVSRPKAASFTIVSASTYGGVAK